MWIVLLFVILLVAIGYVALIVRRTQREQQARSDERASSLLAALRAHGVAAANDGDPARAEWARGSVVASAHASAPRVAAVAPALPFDTAASASAHSDERASSAATSIPLAASAAARVPQAANSPAAGSSRLAALRRPHFLGEPQRMLFLVLRAALPDHVVVAHTRLVDLLDVPADPQALEREPHLRELLHHRLDCLVCRSDLAPLAGVMIYPADTSRPADEEAKADILGELGVKFLRFRADSLPRPTEMRALVLG